MITSRPIIAIVACCILLLGGGGLAIGLIIDEIDVLTIAFSQRAQAGPVNLRQSQTFSHPPSDWRGRLQKLSA